MIELLKNLSLQTREWLADHGWNSFFSKLVADYLWFFIVLVIAFVSYYIVKKILYRLLKRLVANSKSQFDDFLLGRKFFKRLCYFAPAIILYKLTPITVSDLQGLIFFVQRSMSVYMVFIVAISADAFLEASHDYYLTSENSKNRPLKGFIQVGKIIVYAICAIIIISILLEQKPGVLLGGLGAMSAVLLLVFKDSILGFVAGIQLTANNMVKIGDWITLPKHDIDGTISEISLTTVKVQNFDRTTSTLPAYTLVSDSVKNWRGMEESGGRRITRSLFIDVNSVKFCTTEMLQAFEKVSYITDYVKETQAEIDGYNAQNLVDESIIVNGRRQTNLGIFRAYLKAYLKNNPDIKKDMTYLVRHLAPTEKGLPIQIYCFTSTTDWEKYENIQADIFDHILATIPFFELKTFQSPSGADFKSALSNN